LFLDKIFSLFKRKEKPAKFVIFTDPMDNFKINYLENWKFDRDIAVVEGRYTIPFESKNKNFIVSIDTNIPKNFDFAEYAKSELEGAKSGIFTPIRKGNFRKMPAYIRNYSYTTRQGEYFGGGIMFFTGRVVFSILWSGPNQEKEKLEPIFAKMLESIVITKGCEIKGMGA